MKKTIVLFGIALSSKAVAWVSIVCGTMLLIGGIVVVIEMKSLCKKHLSDNSTNAPPPVPPGTNSAGTNSIARFYSVTVMTNSDGGQRTAYQVTATAGSSVHLNDDFVDYKDITGYYQSTDLDGLPYTTILRYNIGLSDNPAGPWKTLSVTGWASTQNLLLCFYSNGIPVLTNYGSLMSPGGIFLGPTNRPSQFYKLSPP